VTVIDLGGIYVLAQQVAKAMKLVWPIRIVSFKVFPPVRDLLSERINRLS
jgi:uncharacterized membrane protein